MTIAIKRAYQPASRADGKRVLVDRLWPRGVSKPRARIDLWLKQLAPSAPLRQWFRHRPEYFVAFRKRYLKELGTAAASQALDQLYTLAAGRERLTLVYGARDETHNNAVVLKQLLEGMRKPPSSSGAAASAARARAHGRRR